MTHIRVVKKIPGLGIIISWIDDDLAKFQKFGAGYSGGGVIMMTSVPGV